MHRGVFGVRRRLEWRGLEMKKLLLLLLLFSLPVMAQPNGAVSTGSLTAQATTCSTPANTSACVLLPLTKDLPSAGIVLSGTFSATTQFEVSVDAVNWSSVNAYPSSGTATAVTSATAAGTWYIQNAGAYAWLRARCSTYSSGTVVVTLNP